MTIELISQEQYDRLLEIQKEFPKLTLQNKGYEYIGKNNLTQEELEAFKEVEDILRKHIVDFVEFTNFRYSTDKTKFENRLAIRLQYKYSPMFTGVGYLFVDELLNGFDDE